MESVHVRSPAPPHQPVRRLLLGDGAIASSGGYFERSGHIDRQVGPHVDGATRRALPTDIAVSVVADRCVVADALTKIVMSDADAARPVLEAWNAEALVHDTDSSRVIGHAA